MKPQDSKVNDMVIMGRMGMMRVPTSFKGSGLTWYITIIASLSFYAFISFEFYLLIVLLFSFFYLPFLFVIRYAPKHREAVEEEKIIVDENIEHFRRRVQKALEENAVAQRDIELKLLNSLAVDLSIRYGIPESVIRRNMENREFLRKYLGEKADLVARMFRRRHELREALPKERFVKEINAILEAMK